MKPISCNKLTICKAKGKNDKLNSRQRIESSASTPTIESVQSNTAAFVSEDGQNSSGDNADNNGSQKVASMGAKARLKEWKTRSVCRMLQDELKSTTSRVNELETIFASIIKELESARTERNEALERTEILQAENLLAAQVIQKLKEDLSKNDEITQLTQSNNSNIESTRSPLHKTITASAPAHQSMKDSIDMHPNDKEIRSTNDSSLKQGMCYFLASDNESDSESDSEDENKTSSISSLVDSITKYSNNDDRKSRKSMNNKQKAQQRKHRRTGTDEDLRDLMKRLEDNII